MKTVSFYETTVADRETGDAVRFVAVPRSAIPADREQVPHGIYGESEKWAQALGLEVRHFVPVGQIPQIIRATLVTDDVDQADRLITRERQPLQPGAGAEFAEYVAFAPVVAAEGSPLDAQSLAEIATKGVGAGMGSFVAFAAFGSTPLLFVAAPVGIVLCGAALGVAEALRVGLGRRLLRLLGVPEEEEERANV
jgi:hypothetical protein